MAKAKGSQTKPDAPVSESSIDLNKVAMELFVRRAEHITGKTPEHLAKESFKDAEVFLRVAVEYGSRP